MDNVLSSIYYNPKHSASFSSKKKLYNASKLLEPDLKLENVENWLSGQDAYTLHRRVKRKFKRKPIIAHNIDETWQIDLADVSYSAKYNDGVKFILVAIDVLSRFAFVAPLLNKSAKSIVEALMNIFKIYKRIPQNIQTDQGKEFLNSSVLRLLNLHNIKHFLATGDDAKCAMAERFIRTLREKITKYVTFTASGRYIDQLQNFADSYNNTIHSRLKLRPIDVTKKLVPLAVENLYGEYYRAGLRKQNFKPQFQAGDHVRIAKKKEAFEKKSETPNFTREVFKVKGVKQNSSLTTYLLEDMDGEDITSIFYPCELVKVKPLDKWEIDQVLDTRISKGIKYGLVKWYGLPNKFNSWVKLTDVT